MHTRTRKLTPWTLFALLMCGCLSGPLLPPYPNTIDVQARTFQSLPAGIGTFNTTIGDHLSRGPVLLVLRTHDAYEGDRNERMIAQMLTSFPEDDRLRVVEVILSGDGRPDSLSTNTPDPRWRRVIADDRMSKSIRRNVPRAIFRDAPTYLITEKAGALALYLWREGLGRLSDLLLELPVSDALDGQLFTHVIDTFGDPTRDRETDAEHGETHYTYTYTNDSMSHDCTTTFSVRGNLVTSAHTRRIHNNPAIVMYSGANGERYAVDDLVSASDESERWLPSFDGVDTVTVEWFNLRRIDAPGYFSAKTTPSWTVDPGVYRIQLRVRDPKSEYGHVYVELKRHVELPAGVSTHLDIRSLIDGSIDIPHD